MSKPISVANRPSLSLTPILISAGDTALSQPVSPCPARCEASWSQSRSQGPNSGQRRAGGLFAPKAKRHAPSATRSSPSQQRIASTSATPNSYHRRTASSGGPGSSAPAAAAGPARGRPSSPRSQAGADASAQGRCTAPLSSSACVTSNKLRRSQPSAISPLHLASGSASRYRPRRDTSSQRPSRRRIRVHRAAAAGRNRWRRAARAASRPARTPIRRARICHFDTSNTRSACMAAHHHLSDPCHVHAFCGSLPIVDGGLLWRPLPRPHGSSVFVGLDADRPTQTHQVLKITPLDHERDWRGDLQVRECPGR